ncbi:ABC transporter ATP-binding protein [Sulfurospirillum diekertiae]|uniref:Lipoprotein-releasing system ATP-binding protein LolD n=1 Tax=Sulfurospirillum diekertiae TaxID=1854492 RepID=A0A1Y0HJX1_9BACT|nr:ATP-binding cassette domain-containing protein [Sulfurospirillum diekertiae]ARU48419.1 Lipoprotein-releasing system ATP-binding protein LolD [Sulfurospirillum diekertiae]ASC93253.1 Lipoprotein-releasing system ATP-binding protein LolD [Sulfurospirillum diekertiae]
MILQAGGITHYYKNDLALDNVNFEAKKGEFIAIVGESGSGKSTLLSILSSLLLPSKGELFFEGKAYTLIKDIDAFRQKEVGFIFQFHYLIGYLTILENIKLAAINKNSTYIDTLFEQCGIEAIKHKYPDEISGGQRQRAAIVRALVNTPKIIFADEPTGNLDSRNSQTIYKLFKTLSKSGTTIIIATHDRHVSDYADKIIEVKDGKII